MPPPPLPPRLVPPSGLPPPTRPPGAATLLGCLRRFVRPEPLASWHCVACGGPRPALKQLSIRRLPPVLCLHVKRFEHGVIWPDGSTGVAGGGGGGDWGGGAGGPLGPGAVGAQTAAPGGRPRLWERKLDTPLLFPAWLDPTPFTSSSVLAARLGKPPGACIGSGGAGVAAFGRSLSAAAAAAGAAAAAAAGDGGTAATLASTTTPPVPLYELYAVVAHRGSLHGGHYTAFVKAGGRWYACDDAAVLPACESAARSAQPYLLFYRAVAGGEAEAVAATAAAEGPPPAPTSVAAQVAAVQAAAAGMN